MPPYRRLQQYAIAISIISVIYNGLEGGVSIGFGAESNSKSLIFFGVQSGIEVISALLVVWRFRKIAKPGEERGVSLKKDDLKFERWGTLGIGILLIVLALGTIASSIAVLVMHKEPDTSNASLIISASALVIMVMIWLPKRYLATALDSSTMRGEAICSLSCIQLTCVLFIGSLIFRVWRGGWWLDGATSMILSILFGWEGYKMVKWARNTEFTGGCCEDCRIEGKVEPQQKKDSGSGTSIADEKCGCCNDIEKGDCGATCDDQRSTRGSEKVSCCGAKDCCEDLKSVPEVGKEDLKSNGSQVPGIQLEERVEVSEEKPASCCSDCCD